MDAHIITYPNSDVGDDTPVHLVGTGYATRCAARIAYRATAEEIHDCYHKAHQRAFALHQAIAHIWRAQVYQDGNRDNGISLEMVDAIRSAARAAGFIGEDVPLSPELSEIDAELARLNAKGVYPKLGKDVPLSSVAAELRKI